MTTLDRNEIWAQAFELGQLILESPEVLTYKAAESAMQSNAEIASKTTKFREMQWQYDKLAEHGTGPHLNGLRQDIEALAKDLDSYPEVQAYKVAMTQVDELLKSVTDLIASTITEKAAE
ncbi:YlbF family regulator [Tumebacillus sp. ITR2]|uniref:YlbF family regulator n=1 Tax=Tumebacillus amylolyticus TaxID=2801339 RepID=A0ABS1JDX0_9BACL|nr:YlbF family regulator [Tumebacillus amylolyticus]MBL0388189.1 YlbF family regulator [Tumebacillus amylolyticus]